MVDVTFPFIILLGGPLAALVTALVRGHQGWRKAADILAASICGPLAVAIWMRVVPGLIGTNPETQISPALSFLLADLLWFSPVFGGFIGLAIVAAAFRLAGAAPRHPGDNWVRKLGDGVRIVGYVYAIIGLVLAIALVALAAAVGETQVVSVALLYDVVVGAVVVLLGWVIGSFAPKPASPANPS